MEILCVIFTGKPCLCIFGIFLCLSQERERKEEEEERIRTENLLKGNSLLNQPAAEQQLQDQEEVRRDTIHDITELSAFTLGKGISLSGLSHFQSLNQNS